jgi:hypothetical protein
LENPRRIGRLRIASGLNGFAVGLDVIDDEGLNSSRVRIERAEVCPKTNYESGQAKTSIGCLNQIRSQL